MIFLPPYKRRGWGTNGAISGRTQTRLVKERQTEQRTENRTGHQPQPQRDNHSSVQLIVCMQIALLCTTTTTNHQYRRRQQPKDESLIASLAMCGNMRNMGRGAAARKRLAQFTAKCKVNLAEIEDCTAQHSAATLAGEEEEEEDGSGINKRRQAAKRMRSERERKKQEK